MDSILEQCKEQAHKMTSHADADAKYAAFKKRWTVIGNKTLFRNKWFALNEIFQQNASKFAIFYV